MQKKTMQNLKFVLAMWRNLYQDFYFSKSCSVQRNLFHFLSLIFHLSLFHSQQEWDTYLIQCYFVVYKLVYLALLHSFLLLLVTAKCYQECAVDDPNDFSGLLSRQNVDEFSSR